MENNRRIIWLFRKYLANDYTESELDEILHYFGINNEGPELIGKLIEQELKAAPVPDNQHRLASRIADEVYQHIFAAPVPIKRRYRIVRWLPYAAAVVIIAWIGVWMAADKHTNEELAPASVVLPDIGPGGNRATLTLANGQQIDLSTEHAGIVVQDSLFYDDRSPIAILPVVENDNSPTWCALTTPNGGTYQIVLPDGTKVWLNAASRLKYPSRFDSEERVVELEGEAYFSVARGKTRNWPFKVSFAGHTVNVLGTEFNISAYPKEPANTTLVEGSVEIVHLLSNATARLSPGEQAAIRDNKFDIQSVDVQKYVAWKDGLFYFKHASFDELIRQIARWYDVAVVYKGKIPTETFSGKMRRDVSLLTILDLMDISKAKIQLEGRTLNVH
ncbi:MAG: FecR family protein [Parapedobacter sp.]|nr:MAG: FecR family protein [Parapedobacter sp.]